MAKIPTSLSKAFKAPQSLLPASHRGDTAHRIFDDPAGIELLAKFSHALQKRGYSAGEVKRGKGCDAAVILSLPRYEAVVVLHVVQRNLAFIDCELSAWPSMGRFGVFFPRKFDGQDQVVWDGFTRDVLVCLQESLGAESLRDVDL